MSEKQIKITKTDRSTHIVPASQRKTYESFNEKNKKLKKTADLVTITDYEPGSEEVSQPAAAKTEGTGTGDTKKTANEVIALIKAATTADEVNALADGDTRATVVKAAEVKLQELAG